LEGERAEVLGEEGGYISGTLEEEDPWSAEVLEGERAEVLGEEGAYIPEEEEDLWRAGLLEGEEEAQFAPFRQVFLLGSWLGYTSRRCVSVLPAFPQLDSLQIYSPLVQPQISSTLVVLPPL